MKCVIVTGANGFIGKHLIDELVKEHIFVIALYFGNGALINQCETVKPIYCDLSNCEGVKESIQKFGFEFDAFYHLAWTGVSSEKKNDYHSQYKNIENSINALTLCNQLQCYKFINIGSVAEYVNCNGLIRSQEVPSPGDIYGATKVASRFLLTAIAQSLHQEMICTILSSTYGEYRLDNNVISYSIKTLLAGEKPIYGCLKQIWDFLYIKDTVYALYLIGEYGQSGSTYGIGSAVYRPLLEYIEKIRDIINPELPLGIGVLTDKYAAIHDSCVDTYLLQKDTGFIPKYSFADGIRNTISWFEKQAFEKQKNE